MWMCTAEIANRSKAPGLGSRVGRARGRECCLTALATTIVFASPLVPSQDTPPLLPTVQHACRGWAIEPEEKRQDCHTVSRWSDPPGRGSLWAESQSDHWLQCSGGGHCSLVAKSFEDGDEVLYSVSELPNTMSGTW